jgi:hypothetical protein
VIFIGSVSKIDNKINTSTGSAEVKPVAVNKNTVKINGNIFIIPKYIWDNFDINKISERQTMLTMKPNCVIYIYTRKLRDETVIWKKPPKEYLTILIEQDKNNPRTILVRCDCYIKGEQSVAEYHYSSPMRSNNINAFKDFTERYFSPTPK